MKTIYLVIHPEAQHHVDGVVGGWYDSDLTELGMRQASVIAAELERRLGGARAEIVSSDLQRATRTAETIARRIRGGLRLDADLREKSYGDAEGRPNAWLRQKQIPIPDAGERLRHDEGIPGAETRMDLAERAYAAMGRVMEASAENQIVVTHNGTATLLIAAWIGMPLESAGRVQFGTTPGSITELAKNTRNHSHMIVRLNGVEHLADESATGDHE